MSITLVKSSSNQQDNVVDHIPVANNDCYQKPQVEKDESARNIIQEFGQWLNCIVSNVVELVDQDLRRLVGDGRRRDGERLVREEVTVVCRGQLRPEI